MHMPWWKSSSSYCNQWLQWCKIDINKNVMNRTAWCVCRIHSCLCTLTPDQRGPCISSRSVLPSRLNGDSFLRPSMTYIAGGAQESGDAAFFMQTSLLCFCLGAGIRQRTPTNKTSYVRSSPQGGSSASCITAMWKRKPHGQHRTPSLAAPSPAVKAEKGRSFSAWGTGRQIFLLLNEGFLP